MKRMINHNGFRTFVVGFVAGLLTFAVMAFNRGRSQDEPVRELVLVAANVAFYMPDQPGKPNPVIVLKKGQPVKLVLRNTEPEKLLHCFTIGELEVKSSNALAGGESEMLYFIPKKKGVFTYACLMHPGMSGKIVVE